jgi:hypothetical protein
VVRGEREAKRPVRDHARSNRPSQRDQAVDPSRPELGAKPSARLRKARLKRIAMPTNPLSGSRKIWPIGAEARGPRFTSGAPIRENHRQPAFASPHIRLHGFTASAGHAT